MGSKTTILLGFIFVVVFFTKTSAQQTVFPLNNQMLWPVEKRLANTGIQFPVSFKPFIKSRIESVLNIDSVYNIPQRGIFFLKNQNSYLVRKIRREHFIQLDTGDLILTIDPVFHFETGTNPDRDITTWQNTRGFRIEGSIGNQLSFYSGFYENQARFNNYVTDFVKKYNIVPGNGFVRSFKTNAWDYSQATAVLGFTTKNNYFNFQFGHGKHFIGNGYRSVLLSDNAFSYPFFRITTRIWNLQYVNLFTIFQNIARQGSISLGWDRKYGSFHYLTWNATKRLEISLFEGIIWQHQDSTGVRGFDPNYLNPVIFYRPVEFSLASPDNALIGANLNFKILSGALFYTQLLLDDFNWGKMKKGDGFFQQKISFQAGFKFYNLFSIPNLYFLAEYNQVRPYTYAHKIAAQNYAHYNQPLAHPLGANFREGLSILRYKYKDWLFTLKYNYAIVGKDHENSHWGSNIFISDHEAEKGLTSFGNYTGQGLETTIQNRKVEFAYLINPKTNLQICAGYHQRSIKNNQVNQSSPLFYFKFITNLKNRYFDF